MPKPISFALLAFCVLISAGAGIAAAQDGYGSQAKSDPAADTPSLYDRLGGTMGISVAVSDLIDLFTTDPELHKNAAIAEAHERVPAAYLKYQVTSMVCQATGGPCQYNGRTMKEAHAHLHISEKDWDRGVVLFKQVMAKHKVGEAETTEMMGLLEAVKPDIVTPAE
jgi:hemoglobin